MSKSVESMPISRWKSDETNLVFPVFSNKNLTKNEPIKANGNTGKANITCLLISLKKAEDSLKH